MDEGGGVSFVGLEWFRQHCVFDGIIALCYNWKRVLNAPLLQGRCDRVFVVFVPLYPISEQAQVVHDVRCFAVALFVSGMFRQYSNNRTAGPNYPELRSWMQLGW